MHIKNLSDSEILVQLKQLVQGEREVLTKILEHLLEVEDRRLHLAEGYPSLFEYGHSAENCRLLCQAHNLYWAQKHFGKEKIS